MTPEQANKLERIKNYRTRYEIVLTNGVDRYLLQYTPTYSMHGLMQSGRSRFEAIEHVSSGAGAYALKQGETREQGKWWIQFTGRTQREAILAGEMSFAKVPETVTA